MLGEQVAGLIDGLHDLAEGFFDVGSAHTVPLGFCYVLGESVWAAEPSWAATRYVVQLMVVLGSRSAQSGCGGQQGSRWPRVCESAAGAYCGPETETEFEFESFRPSSVQIALVALQSVVVGSVMLTAALPAGSTVMVQVGAIRYLIEPALLHGLTFNRISPKLNTYPCQGGIR